MCLAHSIVVKIGIEVHHRHHATIDSISTEFINHSLRLIDNLMFNSAGHMTD